MQPSEADRLNSLARRWADGDDGAFLLLAELSQPFLTEVAGGATASAWLDEVRMLGAQKVRFEPTSWYGFLEWAMERVKLYEEDAHRVLLYAAYGGDEDALDTLYRVTRRELVAALSTYRNLLPDGADLDIVGDFFSDLVADVRLGRHRYAGARGTFMAWASTAVRNRARGMLRDSAKLTAMPEEGETMPPQLIAEGAAEPAFVSWLTSALTAEQRTVFALVVLGYGQVEIADCLNCGSPKVSKTLDEIRARVAERMESGGYRECLAFALDGVRAGKAVKGLLRRLFLRFAALALIAELEPDPDLAGAARAAFGPDPKDALWRVNPENAEAVGRVAKILAALYLRIAAIDPNHPFCSATRQLCAEPWGAPIADALEGAALRSAAATLNRGDIPKGGELV